MRPRDLEWSDVGPWPSIADAVWPVRCACGSAAIARDDLCWSCWARAWAGTTSTTDRDDVQQQTAVLDGATKEARMMAIGNHEAMLVGARQLVQAGPFWLLDLWESLSPSLQQEGVETLAERPSFTAALEAAGVLGNDPLFLDDEELDAINARRGGKACSSRSVTG